MYEICLIVYSILLERPYVPKSYRYDIIFDIYLLLQPITELLSFYSQRQFSYVHHFDIPSIPYFTIYQFLSLKFYEYEFSRRHKMSTPLPLHLLGTTRFIFIPPESRRDLEVVFIFHNTVIQKVGGSGWSDDHDTEWIHPKDSRGQFQSVRHRFHL